MKSTGPTGTIIYQQSNAIQIVSTMSSSMNATPTIVPGSDVLWMVLALVAPFLWIPYLRRRRRQRRNSSFVRGGAHARVDDVPAPTPAAVLRQQCRCCWNVLVSKACAALESLGGKQKNHRVTFAQHSSGEVRSKRYHFDPQEAPDQPVVPDVHTPSPIKHRRVVKQRSAPTPPPKPKQQSLSSTTIALQHRQPSSSTTVQQLAPSALQQRPPEQKNVSTPIDRRTLSSQVYLPSQLIAVSPHAVSDTTTPLSVKYQQQNRKRSRDSDSQEQTTKRRRLPLMATSRVLPRRTLTKKRNRASQEAWLLEAFNRKRVKRVTEESNKENAVIDTPRSFAFGAGVTGTTVASDSATAPAGTYTVANTEIAATSQHDTKPSSTTDAAGHAATTATAAATTENAVKPLFTLGAAAPATARTVPPSVDDDVQPTFTFGSPAAAAASGAAAAPTENGAKPAFTFGAPAYAAHAAAAAPVDNNANSAFTFGARATAANATSAAAAATPVDNTVKPAFTFGAPAASAVAPAHDAKPIFNLDGNGGKSPASSTTAASGTGHAGFSFGAAPTGPSFGATPSFGTSPAPPTFAAGHTSGASARRRAARAGRRHHL